MTMIFVCNPVARKARDGSTEFRGVEWVEAREALEFVASALAEKLLIGGAIVTVLGLVGLFATRSAGALLAMLLGLAVAWAGWECLKTSAIRIPPRRRALHFYADGRIHAPLGLCNDGSRARNVRARFADIANIEVEQRDPKPEGCEVWYTHGVRMLTYDGDVLHVARYLEPDEAHKLATRLSAARERLRDELSGSRQPSGHRVSVLLD